MISAFFKYNYTNYEMTIFNYLKPGVDPNSPLARGGIVDVKNGVYYITGMYGSMQANSLSYTAVKYQINSNGPIAALGSGHYLVVNGYNDDTTQDVYFNDPASGMNYRRNYSWMTGSFFWINSAFWR